ncbi:hypothetical protein Ddye_006703 [Dipteronia dyeriana]|uniref:AMP-dependent synthetase/ligase domain-containing protein n=1 Tax=Dipteronia dyeriana TaxID=168575 RepID=A0AAD9XIZ2_9ROSI|nr:hypothetical protein Ddye_006703 [Dipteronia dyeriana]
MIGAVTTTTNPLCTSSEIFKQVKAFHAELIITLSQYLDKLRDTTDQNIPKIGQDFTVITVDEPPLNCLQITLLSKANENSLPENSIDPDDLVALPFSSGITGLPKGVVLTHKSLITSVAQQVNGENPNLYLKQQDVVLCVFASVPHIFINSVLLCSLRVGAGVLLMHKFEIGVWLELIQQRKVSVVAVVSPLVLELAKNPMVAKFDLGSIRMVLSGAVPLGKKLEEALQSTVPQAILGQVNH